MTISKLGIFKTNMNKVIALTNEQELNNENAIKIIRNIFLNNKIPIHDDSEALSSIAEQLKQLNLLGIKARNPESKSNSQFDIITNLNDNNNEGEVFLYPTVHQIEFYQALEQLKYPVPIEIETYTFDDLYALSKTNATNRNETDPTFSFYVADSDSKSSGIKLSEKIIIQIYENFAYTIQFKPASVLLANNPENHPELTMLHEKLESLCESQKEITQIHVFEGWYNHNEASKQTTLIIETNRKINSKIKEQILKLQKDYINYLTESSNQLNKIETFISPEAADTFLNKYHLTLNDPFIKSHH